MCYELPVINAISENYPEHHKAEGSAPGASQLFCVQFTESVA
jgi:hypothetical protein